MTHALPQDVANELGIPSIPAAQVLQVTGWLSRVEAMIKVRIPDLDARVTAGTIDVALVVGIEAGAVGRKADNRKGLRSVTRSVDDGSMTEVRDSAFSDGVLRITDDEWDLLIPAQQSDAASVRYAYTPDHRSYNAHWWSRPC